MRQFRQVMLVVAGGSMMLGGCRSMSNKDRGTVIGAAAGGAVGAAVGRANGSTARGAIIGAAVGGAAGMIIGSRMDKQAAKIRQRIPGATVERVGEGIQVTFASGLLFDFDSDRVRGDAATNLRTLAQTLQEEPATDLLIVGHTDAVGDERYNQSLSERRARATADFLTAQGVARARLRAMGRGELEPLADNASTDGQQRNRRVEVAIYANEQMKAEARRGGT